MLDFTTTRIAATIGVIVGAYAAGSVNFSLLAARLLGHGDLRSHGSGNAGATNLSRVAGKGPAALVLALDIARGAGVVFAASAAGMDPWSPLAAIPLLLGNRFPVFHNFRGGKGVAAAVGAMLVVSPFAVLAGGGVFFAAFAIGRRVSAGSILMALSYPAATMLLGGSRVEVFTAAGLAVLLVASHRRNIARLAAGTEPRFGARTESPCAERLP
jgi:glycerol-3-phosphate acyltransferase PlsY